MLLMPTVFWILLTINFCARCQQIFDIYDDDDIDQNLTLSCHRRLYTYRVTQTDENGKKCWDMLSVMACWGRCDSHEYADFRFPFKKSYHPVCLHYGRNKAFVILRNCDEGVNPKTARYEYYEAAECKCQVCSSLDTSCEGLRYTARRSLPGFKRFY